MSNQLKCEFVNNFDQSTNEFTLETNNHRFLWKGMSLEVVQFELYLDIPAGSDSEDEEDGIFRANVMVRDQISTKTALIVMSSEEDTHLDWTHREDQENDEFNGVIHIDVDKDGKTKEDDNSELREIVRGLNLNSLFNQAMEKAGE